MEVRDGSLFAYSPDGEFSALDSARWAWAVSVASPLLDTLGAWDPDFARVRAALPFTAAALH